MNVQLINVTKEARELLIFTKATRLTQDADLLEQIRNWPEEKKQAELAYILGTIESSWEFVHYTFLISGISRACSIQLMRTRDADIPDEEYIGPRHKKFGSFAAQSQRTVDMSSGATFVMPDTIRDSPNAFTPGFFNTTMEGAEISYQTLRGMGIPPQDARAVLPHATSTNLIADYNLRTLSEMAKLRLCTRAQGEYQALFRAMRDAVLAVHPWAEPFLRVYCAAVGVCCFPNYKECPIKPGIFNPATGGMHPNLDGSPVWDRLMAAGKYVSPLTKDEIQVRWEGTRFEAVPQQMTKEPLPVSACPRCKSTDPSKMLPGCSTEDLLNGYDIWHTFAR